MKAIGMVHIEPNMIRRSDPPERRFGDWSIVPG